MIQKFTYKILDLSVAEVVMPKARTIGVIISVATKKYVKIAKIGVISIILFRFYLVFILSLCTVYIFLARLQGTFLWLGNKILFAVDARTQTNRFSTRNEQQDISFERVA